MADSLLQEVDDDLRADKMLQLWREWRMPLLYAAVALIVGTAGKSVWHQYREQRAQKAMTTMVTARDAYAAGDFAAAEKGFALLAAQSGGDLHDMALLWQGRAELAGGEKDKAVTTYRSLAEHPKGHELAWRDLACLRLAGLSDAVPASCDGAAKSPLKLQREEFQAARLWQAGKVDEARAMLKSIVNDPDVSDGQRSRDTDLLATLAPEKAAK